MWGFESAFGAMDNWVLSAKRFETKEAAIKAALDWAEINLANDFAVAVRVVKI